MEPLEGQISLIAGTFWVYTHMHTACQHSFHETITFPATFGILSVYQYRASFIDDPENGYPG